MTCDVVIVGAGIVGLSTAYNLLVKDPGLNVCILEKEDGIARHQTARNSGVIHSGVYYKPGSQKALNCREGYNKLLTFCDENNITYDICGKLIVAVNHEEKVVLDSVYEKGIANGLKGLKKIPGEDIQNYEPHVSGVAAIYVPQTGIIDFSEVAKAFEKFVTGNGATVVCNQKVTGIKKIENARIAVQTDKEVHTTKLVINCAGLYSDEVAKLTDPAIDIKILPFRGEYYCIRKDRRHLVKNLVYPAPDPVMPWLGVHFTRKISGEIEAGPNAVLAYKREGYSKTEIDVRELLGTVFYPGFLKLARKYWYIGWQELKRSYSKKEFTKGLNKLIPELTEDDLEAGGSGVRALACDRNGNFIDDFVFIENNIAINVCNAPSPAATSNLAIGEKIAEKAIQRLT